MLWKHTLSPDEFFFEYFDDRRALQRFVYGDDAVEKEYIDGMLSGIPVNFHPTIKAEIKPADDIDDLWRIFIDQEPGLRPNKYREDNHIVSTAAPWKNPNLVTPFKGTNTVTTFRVTNSQPLGNVAKASRPPPAPCVCGGNHWRSDCPTKGQLKPFFRAKLTIPHRGGLTTGKAITRNLMRLATREFASVNVV